MLILRNLFVSGLMACLLIACAQTRVSNEVGANGLPTPRALFARYVEALGGETVIRSHSSTTSRGRFILSSFGVEGSVEAFAAAPNRVSMTIDMSGVGRIESGYNGEVGWSVDPLQGSTVMQGEQLAYMIQQADYYLPLHLQETFSGEQTVAMEEVAGQNSYQVQVIDATGKLASMFFHVDSGLLVRTVATVASPLGDIEVISDFAEYAAFDGLQVPVVTNINQGGQEISIHFTEITFDNVSASRFRPPAAIQSMLR